MKFKDTGITIKRLEEKLKEKDADNSNIVLIPSSMHSGVYNEDTAEYITFVKREQGKLMHAHGIRWTTKDELINKQIVLSKIHALRRKNNTTQNNKKVAT